ncbi:unnamed protein product, partial [Porites lobata]
GYSRIPEKLVTKIRTGQFVDLADLLGRKRKRFENNVLRVPPSLIKNERSLSWVEAFTIFYWIFCSAHPSKWPDLTQYKLLIIKTSCQFSGKPGSTMTWPFVGMQQHLKGRVALPFSMSPLPNLHISRFGIIPKKYQSGKWRLILDLFENTIMK